MTIFKLSLGLISHAAHSESLNSSLTIATYQKMNVVQHSSSRCKDILSSRSLSLLCKAFILSCVVNILFTLYS